MGGSILSATIPAATEKKTHLLSVLDVQIYYYHWSCPALKTPVMRAEFGNLLTAMIGIQDQMQSMKRELAEEREAVNERLVKCIRLEKPCIQERRPRKAVSF